MKHFEIFTKLNFCFLNEIMKPDIFIKLAAVEFFYI